MAVRVAQNTTGKENNYVAAGDLLKELEIEADVIV